VHEVVHCPQCRLLVLKSTQLAPHAVLPAGQPQTPPEQSCAAGHFVPHAPHELAVVCRFTQASPQRVSPFGHGCVLGMQRSTAQISPGLQALPQAPQFCGVFKFEHSVPQTCSPLGHWQAPSRHAFPPLHAVSQLPQCWASDIGSKHWPWQNNTPSGQPHTPP
jgi:hypothetical protein